MGRCKIPIVSIENSTIRAATLRKRKKGLIKKAMELSLLCKVKVYLLICVTSDKVIQYNSHPTEDICTSASKVEQFTNENYNLFSKDPIPDLQLKSMLQKRLSSSDQPLPPVEKSHDSRIVLPLISEKKDELLNARQEVFPISVAHSEFYQPYEGEALIYQPQISYFPYGVMMPPPIPTPLPPYPLTGR